MTIEQAQKLAKQRLSSKRYQHEKNVVAAAVLLARQHGEDEQKAALAGWLHDIVKEESDDVLLRLLGEDAIIAGCTERRPRSVWHGPCAAIYAKHSLGVQNADVLSAIACHTTGKAGMAKLDKILYVADMISAERNYPGVQQLRSMALKNLDAAVVAAMQQTMRYVQQRGKVLDEESVKALQAMQPLPGADKGTGGNEFEP